MDFVFTQRSFTALIHTALAQLDIVMNGSGIADVNIREMYHLMPADKRKIAFVITPHRVSLVRPNGRGTSVLHQQPFESPLAETPHGGMALADVLLETMVDLYHQHPRVCRHNEIIEDNVVRVTAGDVDPQEVLTTLRQHLQALQDQEDTCAVEVTFHENGHVVFATHLKETDLDTVRYGRHDRFAFYTPRRH